MAWVLGGTAHMSSKWCEAVTRRVSIEYNSIDSEDQDVRRLRPVDKKACRVLCTNAAALLDSEGLGAIAWRTWGNKAALTIKAGPWGLV